MSKLTFKKRVWIVKQYEKGISAKKLALAQKIHRSAVYQLIEKFNQFGWDGLKDHKTGRPDIILNEKAIEIILDLRKKYRYGACHIEEILKTEGFSISNRQIEKILLRNNLVAPNIKKQRPRKWVRYELPNPNGLWHTDWSYDPFSGKNISVYIDDRTRLVTSWGIFSRASAENSLGLLKTGIAEYGKPKAVMTDHGSQFYANKCTPDNQNTKFRKYLSILGIKHCLARVNRPQTNGKVERFFSTYKQEYIQETFSCVADFIRHYNEARLHMSLGYRTPKEVWNELKSV
jgi:putative transposase